MLYSYLKHTKKISFKKILKFPNWKQITERKKYLGNCYSYIVIKCSNYFFLFHSIRTAELKIEITILKILQKYRECYSVNELQSFMKGCLLRVSFFTYKHFILAIFSEGHKSKIRFVKILEKLTKQIFSKLKDIRKKRYYHYLLRISSLHLKLLQAVTYLLDAREKDSSCLKGAS